MIAFEKYYCENGGIIYNGRFAIMGSKVKKLENGGIVDAPSHEKGGETFVVERTGEVVELEGEEGVINDKAMRSKKVHKVKGTIEQIVHKLNKAYSSTYKEGKPVDEFKGGESVINKKSMRDRTVYTLKGTPKQIANQINQMHGGKPIK